MGLRSIPGIHQELGFGGFGWLDWFRTSYIYGLKNIYTYYLITFSAFVAFSLFFFFDMPGKYLAFRKSVPGFFYFLLSGFFTHFSLAQPQKRKLYYS
jgi:hypothetical protein